LEVNNHFARKIEGEKHAVLHAAPTAVQNCLYSVFMPISMADAWQIM
jgi:hypothetical protein